MSSKDKNYFQLDSQSGSVAIEMLFTMHPGVVLMIAWTNLWCLNHGINPMWTSWKRTPEQNKALGASSVHEYRAADLSIKKVWGWTPELRNQFEREFFERFRDIGALSKAGRALVSRPIVRHDSGHGDHFHIQVRP